MILQVNKFPGTNIQNLYNFTPITVGVKFVLLPDKDAMAKFDTLLSADK